MKDSTRDLTHAEVADLQQVLSTPAGRRFYHRVVFALGNLESPSWCPEVRDGVAAAMHQGFLEGVRAIGRQLMLEAQHHAGERWAQLVEEGIAQWRQDALHREKQTKASAMRPEHE
jgi:hypothetical protein